MEINHCVLFAKSLLLLHAVASVLSCPYCLCPASLGTTTCSQCSHLGLEEVGLHTLQRAALVALAARRHTVDDRLAHRVPHARRERRSTLGFQALHGTTLLEHGL